MMASSSPDFYTRSFLSSDDYISPPDDHPEPSSKNAFLLVLIVLLFFTVLFLISLHICCKLLFWSTSTFSAAPRFGSQSPRRAPNGGLSKATIARLPTFTYTAPPPPIDHIDSSLECAVCLSEFEEGEQGRMLPACKHNFHIQCIDMWFCSHTTCPLCRTQVTMPTVPTSPPPSVPSSSPLPNSAAHDQQRRGEEEPETPHHQPHLTLGHTDTPPSANANANAPHIPTNVLFYSAPMTQLPSAAFTQQGSSPILEQPSSSSCSAHRVPKRWVPHITIEIPTTEEEIQSPSPGCLSLPSQRSKYTSPVDQARSPCTPLKSPTFQASLKRMLSMQTSKGKRLTT